jgi:hypothetical protein
MKLEIYLSTAVINTQVYNRCFFIKIVIEVKVSGFTFIRNAVKYDYPIVEAGHPRVMQARVARIN